MKTYKFTVKEHKELGMLGFAPQWYPNGDPLSGMAVAHDILEHFPNDEGEAEGEFMALGASYRIRGETGYFQRNGNVNTPAQHLASDFPMIFDITEQQRGSTRIKPCLKKARVDPEIREMFQRIIEYAKEELAEQEREEVLYQEDEQHIINWLTLGYVKAEQRYSWKKYRFDFYSLAHVLFQSIEEQADRLLKRAEEGMELTVRVNLRQLEATCELDYAEDSY